MRLIDADALRDAIIRHRPSALAQDPRLIDPYKDAIDEAVGELDDAPTVRCGECAYEGECEATVRPDTMKYLFVRLNACSYFERRTP